MNAEFNWWLLIVGLVVGGGLVWLVVADSARRDADILDDELPAEAAWIADSMGGGARGAPPDPAVVERILRLHRAYLTLPPPDLIPTAEPELSGSPPAPAPTPPLQEVEPERNPEDPSSG